MQSQCIKKSSWRYKKRAVIGCFQINLIFQISESQLQALIDIFILIFFFIHFICLFTCYLDCLILKGGGKYGTLYVNVT